MPAEEDPLSLGDCPGLLASTANSLHAFNGKNMLVFCRPPRFLAVLREIGEEQEARKGKWQRDNAIDDK